MPTDSAAGPSDGVVIVGAGPTGLILAAELALAGVRCVLLERRAGPRDDSRAICLHARSMEMLDLRGQAAVFAGAGLPVPSFPLGPRGARIGFGALDSDFPYMLDLPQSQIERLLLARALDLGADVRWSVTVTGVSQDETGVVVTMADGRQERAGYIVGCDGVRSFVRDATAIPFPGVHNPGSVILADLRLGGLPMDSAYGDLSANGMLLVFPFRDGTCRVVLYDFARADVPVTEPVALAEVSDGLRRVVGQDFGPFDMTWSGRYRSESRQAQAYRSGRVLLAGDAAHAHSPAGAQGMNTGLQDAVNLGWKLAATLGGWGPEWLLDSYDGERHPVGAAVLALTGRQFRLNTVRSPAGRALRWAVHRLIVPLPPVQARLARDYSGISVNYPPVPPGPVPPGAVRTDGGPAGAVPAGSGPGVAGVAGVAGVVSGPREPGEAGGRGLLAVHRLAGSRLPRARLTLADGATVSPYDLLHDGRFLLLDQSAAGGAPILPDRIRNVSYHESAPRLPPALLVRPDGYVAWASDEPDPPARRSAAISAVQLWCGPR